jgi:hypothetical protein
MDQVKMYTYNLDKTGLNMEINQALNTLCVCIVHGQIDKTSAFNNPINAFEKCLEMKDFILPADTLKKAIEIFKSLKLDGPIIDVNEMKKEELNLDLIQSPKNKLEDSISPIAINNVNSTLSGNGLPEPRFSFY